MGQIFYVITCVIAKLSVCITLLRITIDRLHAWVIFGAMTLSVVVGLIFFFFTIFQCHPVNYFWNRGSETGACIDMNLLIGIAYLYSVGAALTDLTIGLLPVALIWNLHMNQRTKAAIVGILGIGCMFVALSRLLLFILIDIRSASAAVIIRIPFVHHYKDREFLCMRIIFAGGDTFTDNLQDNTYQISIWSNVEAGLGITAGSLTTLRPLIRFLRDNSSASPSRTARSFPLSSNVAPGPHRSSRSKHEDREDVHQLWTGSEMDDYHGVTTTIMGSQQPNSNSTSEEDLNPTNLNNTGWKVERSVRVSVRDE